MSKFKHLLKKKLKFIVIIAFVLLIVASIFWIFSRQKNGGLETFVVKKGDFLQTVAVSGKVIPSESVQLSFNQSGKIISVPVRVGQSVFLGQTIASLDSREAAIALDTARLELKKLLENSVLSGSESLSKDAEESLQRINQAFAEVETISNGLDSLLNDYQVSTYKANLPNDTARAYFNSAQASFNLAESAYDESLVSYKKLGQSLTEKEVVALVETTYAMTKKMSQAVKESDIFVSYIYDQYNFRDRPLEVTTDKANIASWRTTIDSDVSDLSLSRNTLKNSNLDIEAQRLLVSQKELEYSEHFLRAPFSGTITQLDAKVGENAISGQVLAEMNNDTLFQIESYVPEINIANVQVGNPAEITLDAYGDTLFQAKVISIDPAETMKDGVSTYKIKLQFLKKDSRIKSGMTANLVLTTEKKVGVISIPSKAIEIVDTQKIVRVKQGEQLVEKVVTTGSVGALGQTEILSGLEEGDEVVIETGSN